MCPKIPLWACYLDHSVYLSYCDYHLAVFTLTKIVRKSWEKDRHFSPIFSKWEYFCLFLQIFLWFLSVHAKWCSFSTITWYVFIKSSSIELCVHWNKSWDNYETKSFFFLQNGTIISHLTNTTYFLEEKQTFFTRNCPMFFTSVYVSCHRVDSQLVVKSKHLKIHSKVLTMAVWSFQQKQLSSKSKSF